MSMATQRSEEASQPPVSAWSRVSLGDATQRAAELKVSFQAAVHRAVALRDRLARLQAAMVWNRPPQRTDLQQLYAAAGVELPGVALRRFEEVEVFYNSVVANRRAHLATEVQLITAEAEEAELQAFKADQARREILRMLAAD